MKNSSFVPYDKDVSFLSNITINPEIEVIVLYTHFMKSSQNEPKFVPHSHSFFELHIILNGNCRMNSKNKTFNLTKHDYTLISPGMNHVFSDYDENFFRFSLAFDILYKQNHTVSSNILTVAPLNSNCIFYTNSVLSEYVHNNIGYKNIINAGIDCILIDILRSNGILEIDSLSLSSLCPPLCKAIQFIERNISRKITVSDVAANVFLSTRHLNRIFMQDLNMTVTEYIKSKKINLIKKYLKKTDLPIKEIARLSGIESDSALCKLIKKELGMSAKAYRFSD